MKMKEKVVIIRKLLTLDRELSTNGITEASESMRNAVSKMLDLLENDLAVMDVAVDGYYGAYDCDHCVYGGNDPMEVPCQKCELVGSCFKKKGAST